MSKRTEVSFARCILVSRLYVTLQVLLQLSAALHVCVMVITTVIYTLASSDTCTKCSREQRPVKQDHSTTAKDIQQFYTQNYKKTT